MVYFSLAAENQRSTAFRAGLFSKQKQNCRRALNRTPKTKPCAQLDATRIHPGDSPEIDDYYTPSSAVQQQVGCFQRLFETLPRLHASATSSHWRRRIGFSK